MKDKKLPGNMALMRKFALKSKNKNIIYNDTAVTYNRCSTEKQHSVEWQEKITAEYVRNHNWTLIKSFGEKESASTNDRDEYQEMMQFCEDEKIGHIVFYSYDRFSRAGDNSVLDELELKGIKVHGATQEVNSDTPSGKMTQRLYMLFAKMENDQRREKVVEGLKNKLRKGEWVSNPTIGYSKGYVKGAKEHEHEKRQCIINQTGETLRQAFYWKDKENLTEIQIAARLKPMGLNLTPRQLTRVFRNPFYCGYITHSLLDEGEIILGKHEPLVDEATFFRINGMLDKRAHGWKKVNHDEEMPLKASVKCGLCGQPLTGYVQKKIYVYYKCRNKGCCVNLSAKKLHQLFADRLSQFAVASKLIPLVKNQLETTYMMLHRSEAVRIKPMKDESAHLKNELEAMELNLATGKLPLELFLKHSGVHKQRIEAIEAELEILGKDTSNLGLYLDSAIHFLRNLPEMWQKLNLDGKIRLQTLIFPEGLLYLPENDTVRTLLVNPIFSVITSISNNLVQNSHHEKGNFDEKCNQVYSGFPSSNFFWENLEKTALEFRRIKASLVPVPLWVESKTGSTLSSSYVFESNSTVIPDIGTPVSGPYPLILGSDTGSTECRLVS